MEIVRKLGGYSLGRSDMVRRAMSKKKHSVMEQERNIFDSMMDFASYAFNKSHKMESVAL